jgi:hypothetical protein
MKTDTVTKTAKRICNRIAEDIRDRSGLGNAWEAIDEDIIKDEIFPIWREIIAEEIAKTPRKPKP